MSTLAIKDGVGREVIRSRSGTRNGPGTRWCPFCDHSSQLNRSTCRGCGAVFHEDVEIPPEGILALVETLLSGPDGNLVAPDGGEEAAEPESSSQCSCGHGHNHHNGEGLCRYRQYCNCEGFSLTPATV